MRAFVLHETKPAAVLPHRQRLAVQEEVAVLGQVVEPEIGRSLTPGIADAGDERVSSGGAASRLLRNPVHQPVRGVDLRRGSDAPRRDGREIVPGARHLGEEGVESEMKVCERRVGETEIGPLAAADRRDELAVMLI